MPQGLKAVKDAFKKKNLTAFGGGRGSYAGASAAHDARQSQRHEYSNRGKQNKHSGTGGGNQNNGNNLSKKSLLPVC